MAGTAVFAEEVTGEQAKTAVRNWVRRSPMQMTAAFVSDDVRLSQTSRGDDGKALYHVVEMEDGGFVVTSGDTELPPVIAFSASGSLDLSDHRNPLVALLEQDMSNRVSRIAKPKKTLLAAAPSAGGDPVSSGMSFEDEWASLLEEPEQKSSSAGVRLMAAASSISDVRVAPMVQSKWNQAQWNKSNTFNYYTPNNYVCGCVATAFAQIMRYWQMPSGSVSAGTYACWVDGAKVSTKMKGGTYSWSSMPLTESSCSTLAQRQAIGKLVYDVGVASQMQWSRDGSGTYGCMAAQALRHRFGYVSAHSYRFGDSGYLQGMNISSDEEFCNAILASLDAGMPVAIGIQAPSVGGHEVVVDGYGYNGGTLVYCHINCGWSGSDDAWYNLIGEGITGYGFSLLGDVAYNIHPTISGDVISGRVLNASGSPVSGATVTLTASSGTQQATTNAKGIYYFRAPADATYTLTASHGGMSSSPQSVTLPSSYDTEWTFTELNADGTPVFAQSTYNRPYPFGKFGNKWGVNLTLSSSPTVSLQTALDNTALTFTTGGASAWFGQTAKSNDGVDAARSGSIGNGRQTWLETTINGPGMLSFCWNVSCEGDSSHVNYDYLSVSIDDEEKSRICGTDVKWAKMSYSIPSGSHTVRWLYSKDSSTSKGDDAGYVDQVVWEPTASSGDAYDPDDDTAAGGTLITPSDTLSTHDGHTLSSTDKYDFFKVYLTAGYKYVFETTGSMDTYGDLFDSTTLANNVACNDDGGANRNFKIEYVPESSGTCYLRIRAYKLGTAGSYSLSYQRFTVDGGGSSTKPDLLPYAPSGWSSPLVVSDSNLSRTGSSSFSDSDTLYVSWAVVCRNAGVSETFYTRLYVDGELRHSWYTSGLQKNYYAWVAGYMIGNLDPGAHVIKVVHDETGVVAESNESNNTVETTVTVTSGGLPNLKVVGENVSKTTVALSETFTLHWRMENNGKAQAAKSKTRLRIYRSGTGSTQPTLLKTIWIDSAPLAAGAGRDCKKAICLKSFGTGTYSLEVVVDGKSSIAENDETDNSSTVNINVTKNIATRSWALVDWQYHKLNSSEPATFYLSTSAKSKKKATTFKRGQKIYVQLNFWNAKKNVRTLDGVYVKAQINGGASQTWYWPPMGSSTTGYISNSSRTPSFLQNLPVGSYTLTATLDCYDNWWEVSENNNIKRISFKVVDVPTIYGKSEFECALNEPVNWAISSEGTLTAKGLPPGLKFSGGAITGKPRKTGTFTVKFTAKNVAGTRTKTVRIVVKNPGFAVDMNVRANGATDTMSVSAGDTVPMFVGVAQNISVAATPGKEGVAKSKVSSVSVKGLPPGLKYSKGVISGIPSKTGTYTVKLVFKNALGWTRSFSMKMRVNALPAFARGTFNGWTYDECGDNGECRMTDAVRKMTFSVTSAGKMSAKIGSLKFSGAGWTVDQDGCYRAKLRTVRTAGTGKKAKKYTDVLTVRLDPGKAWTEDQLGGRMATFSGNVSLADAVAALDGGGSTLAPLNADTHVSARRNPFGDNADAKAVAAALAAQGARSFTDDWGIAWKVKVAPNGVATISRTTGTGKNRKTISASAVIEVDDDAAGIRGRASFLVSGKIVLVEGFDVTLPAAMPGE